MTKEKIIEDIRKFKNHTPHLLPSDISSAKKFVKVITGCDYVKKDHSTYIAAFLDDGKVIKVRLFHYLQLKGYMNDIENVNWDGDMSMIEYNKLKEKWL